MRDRPRLFSGDNSGMSPIGARTDEAGIKTAWEYDSKIKGAVVDWHLLKENRLNYQMVEF